MNLDSFDKEVRERLFDALDRSMDYQVIKDNNGTPYTVRDILPRGNNDQATERLQRELAFNLMGALFTEVLSDKDLVADIMKAQESVPEALFETYEQAYERKYGHDSDKE